MTDIDAIRKRDAQYGDAHWIMDFIGRDDEFVLADRRALLSAYDAKCEELAAAEQDAEDERAQLRKHCGCEFEDVEVAERPRIAICLPHLAVERERDAAVRREALAKVIFQRAASWFEIQEVALRNAQGAKARSIANDMRCWLAALAPPTEQQKVEA